LICWPRRRTIARAVLIFWFSWVCLVAFGATLTLEQFDAALRNPSNRGNEVFVVQKFKNVWQSDPILAPLCADVLEIEEGDLVDEVKKAITIKLRYPRLSERTGPAQEAARAAQARLNTQKVDTHRSENWIVRAFDRFTKWLSNLFSRRSAKDAAEAESAVHTNYEWVSELAWGILFVGVVVGAYFAVRQIRFRRRARKVSAMLDDDEPERTADEWLLNADGLAAQGKIREAVRSLFVASLIRIDEAGIARFVRGQTNWEHYRRIQNSKARPAAFDFLEPTQRFDDIWYGFKVRGEIDVQYFREVYQQACTLSQTTTN
jgi:hypothetical protein